MFNNRRVDYRFLGSIFPAVFLSALVAVTMLIATPAPCAAADESATFKDPTRPPLKKVAPLPIVQAAPIIEVIVETKRLKRPVKRRSQSLVLNSVLVSNQRRRAVINGRLVREGQTVAGARILSISQSGVRVQRAGRTQTLSLARASVKRRATGLR